MTEGVDHGITSPDIKTSLRPIFKATVADMPIEVYSAPKDFKRHNYQSPDVTNETVPGLKQRAEMLAKIGPVAHFVGVGRAEKVVAQATLLQPKKVTHIDIDDKNITDGLPLIAGLKSGIPIEQAFQENQQDIEAFIDRLRKSSTQYARSDALGRWISDDGLKHILKKMDISYQDMEATIKAVNEWKVIRGSIKDERILRPLLTPSSNGITVCDFSNVPMPFVPENVHIFSALNSEGGKAQPTGVSTIGGNTIWNFPTKQKFDSMVVAYSPNFTAYQEISELVNRESHFNW